MSTGPANTGPLIPGPLGAGGRGASRFGVQAFLIIAFLFLCGLAGTGIKAWRTAPVAEQAKPAAKKFTVVLSAADLDVGREIRASDMYTLSVGAEEHRSLTAGKTCFGVAKELVGRIIRTKVNSGSPFTLDCVYPDGTGPTPADLLSDGMRAVTVRMGLVGGLRGMVSPESWVDVMFRRNSATGAPESTNAARTHTLFAGVRVLGIQDSLYPETVLRKDARGIVADKFEVTLELTPAQCEVLKSVEDRGELSLNMLPREDGRHNDGSVPEPEIMKILLGVDPPEIPLTPTPIPSVKVTRGGNTSHVPVEQVVDTIIDSNLYPAPLDAATAVPAPPGPRPATAEDQWPPKSTIPPPESTSETVPQSLPLEPQAPGSPPPGASRPADTSGGSTLVRRQEGPERPAFGVRMTQISPGSIPQTRRVFSDSNRNIAVRQPVLKPAVPRRAGSVYPVAAGASGAVDIQRVRSAGTSRALTHPQVRSAQVRSAGPSHRTLLSSGRYSGSVPADAFWSTSDVVRATAVSDNRRPAAAISRGAGYPPAAVRAKSALPGLHVIAGRSRTSQGPAGLSDLKVGRR